MASEDTDFKLGCEQLDIIEVTKVMNLVEYLHVEMIVNYFSVLSCLLD